MYSHLKAVLALSAVGAIALFGTPAFAADPDVDSPAGPELPTARTDRPDFQQDERPGQLLDPQEEGADPSPPSASVAPDVVIPEPVPPVDE
jgi:hypothetical protein